MIYDFDNLYFNILNVMEINHHNKSFTAEPRPYSAFSFRMGGKGEFMFNDCTLTSNEGDIIFIPPNIPYKVKYTNSSILVVHFSECNYNHIENFHAGDYNYVKTEFENLLLDRNKPHNINQTKSRVYKILQYIRDTKNPAYYDTEFNNCLEYINTNLFSAELNISDICRNVHISPSSLLRKFNTYYGITPKQFIINERLKKASDLLATKELLVKEVAYACGFKDEKYFSRLIKNKYGYNPSHLNKKTAARLSD